MNRPSSRIGFDTFGRAIPLDPREVERVRSYRDRCEAKRKATAEAVRLARERGDMPEAPHFATFRHQRETMHGQAVREYLNPETNQPTQTP